MSNDEQDNLSREWQAHGDRIFPDTPVIDYSWDFAAAASGSGGLSAGRNRLMAMVYPARENGARRTVSLDYGSAALWAAISTALARSCQ